MDFFHNKVAVITGGNSGIGLSIAKTINYSTKLIKHTEGFMVFTSRLSKITALNSDLASTNDGYSCSSIKRKDFIDKLNTYLEGAGSNKFIQDLKIKYSLQTH